MNPKTPSAPTKSTKFGGAYKNPRTKTVYVYHSRSYYSTPGYWGLHRADYMWDPYFTGGFFGGIYYPANYWNPLSPWYMHPVYIASSCRSQQQAPANEQAEQPPVNINITNEGNVGAKPEDQTTTTTVPSTTTTTG